MKKILPILLITLVAFALGACTYDFHTVINEDESGQFIMSITYTEDDADEFMDYVDADNMGSFFGEDPEEWCEYFEEMMSMDASDDFPSDPEFEYIEERGSYTCQMTVDFDDLDELESIFAEEDFRVRMNDGAMSYSAEMDSMDMPSPSDIRDEGLNIDMEYYWRVTAPGRVTEHNGDEISGSTVTWELRPDRSSDFQLESEAGGFALPGVPDLPDFGLPVPTWSILLFCCCCMSFLVIIIVLILFMRRRKKKSA